MEDIDEVGGTLAVRTVWAIFADRVMSPTLDSADVELVRAQLLASASQQRLHPDAELRIVADSLRACGQKSQSVIGRSLPRRPYRLPSHG